MKNQIIILAFTFIVSSLIAQQKGINQLPTANRQLPTSTYAVVVGISDYQDPGIPDLRFADKDAEAFAGYLRSNAGGNLDNDHLKVLINEHATLAQFAIQLDWLLENAKENDKVIIYFSGHGDVEKKTLTQPGFLLCWDAPAQVYMSGGAFALPMLQEVVSTLSVQNKSKVIIITDACRSGKLSGSSINGNQLTNANLAKQYANEIKILSCQPNEYSIEGEQWGGGRGAFSYNLVNALYGMADQNNDLIVNLQEAGRYLEDHVTSEVAPVSQVPIILGTRTEILSKVDVSLLESLKSGKANQQVFLSSIDSRGMEEEVLKGVDTSIRLTYKLFKKALKDKLFLEPADQCADSYYRLLVNEPKLGRLHSTMTRNYAAALQDDAQQAMNIWLKADVQQLHCIGKNLKLEPIPKQLKRATDLLGSKHYMFASLQARQMLFKSILLQKHKNPDEGLGKACLALLRQSADLEPQSPLPWQQMSQIYLVYLRSTDSAFYCARKAVQLSPNWVLPMADLAYTLINEGKYSEAKLALEEAEKVDPNHPYVINRWASWFSKQPGEENLQKSYFMFDQYRSNGSPVYPCWYNDYAMVLIRIQKFSEAEQALNSAMELDSTNLSVLNNLGRLYSETKRMKEAEAILLKAISIDSAEVDTWIELGYLYRQLHRYQELENVFKKAISLDSTSYYCWLYLGAFYSDNNRYEEAEKYLKKTISLDSTIVPALQYLGNVYSNMDRYLEAEYFLKKAISIDSTQILPYNNLGKIYLNLSRYADAEQILIKAISIDSNIPQPYRHLGMVYYKTNRPDKARQNFLKAIELNPDYAAALKGMAYLLAAEGKTTEALEYVEQAIIKGTKLEQLELDEDLASLRNKIAWSDLMKKYFPDK